MNAPPTIAVPRVGAPELRRILEPMFSEHFGRPCRIGRLKCQPFVSISSFAILAVEATLEDGLHLQLVIKMLGRQGLLESARGVKPDFLLDPLREIAVYRSLLPDGPPGPAACYGTVVDEAGGRYWLVLERVAGLELYQVGDFRLWEAAAGWLADFHVRLAPAAGEKAAATRLLLHDGDYYRLWPQRALAFARQGLPAGGAGGRSFLEWLAARYGRVVERLLALPVSVIHGESYASNLLVQQSAGGVRVCPVDWEMAAVGASLLDLAALGAGGLTPDQRKALAAAYRGGLIRAGGRAPEVEELCADLAYCHLHLNLQWLGWASGWTPPPAHRQDWLAEAVRLAEQVGL